MDLPSDCNYATSTDNGGGNYTLNCPSSGTQTILSQQQGICPSGWHIPSFPEWHTLEYYLSDDPTNNCATNHSNGQCEAAGSKLKADATWGDGSNNSSGFSARPAGFRSVTGSFIGLTWNGFLWSTTPDGVEYAVNPDLYNSDPGVYIGVDGRANGMSVYCLQN